MTEWNMRNTSTTQPINILASNDEYGESGVDHHRNHFNDNDDLDVEFNNLTVGSLPSIRRERRLIVSSGNHEFISNGATNAGQRSPSLYRRRHSGTSFRSAINALNNSNNSNRRRQHSDSSAVHRMAIASSMPVPSAPFLASRNDQASGDRLSSIPNMALPESVSESFSSKPVPHGSLNESQFRFPNGNSYQSRGSYIPNSPNFTSEMKHEDKPSQQSYSGTYNLQQRVEEMRKNGTLIKNQTKSGIAALLGDSSNNEKKDKEQNTNSTSPKKSLGIGALLNEFGQNQKTDNTSNDLHQNGVRSRQPSIPSSIKIGSNSTNASMLTTQNQSQTTTYSQYLDSNSNPTVNNLSKTPNVLIPNNNGQNHHESYDEGYNNSSNFESSQSNNQICGSLTGLDILKQSPRGMANLSPQETKAMLDIQARSRSYSDEVKRSFLNDGIRSNKTSSVNVVRQDMYTNNYHHEDGDMSMRYQNFPPANILQRCNSNLSDSSLNHGDTLGHDPDIDGAFDLDMEC